MATSLYYQHLLYDDDPFDVYYRKKPEPSNEHYVEKMRKILSAAPTIGVPPEPSVVIGTVYLGTSANAENLALLKAYGINHVLNCAGGRPFTYRRMRQMYTAETNIKAYEELGLEDEEDCNIRAVFDRAHTFINMARTKMGRVLIYGTGVSMAGAISMSYLMHNGVPLLEAVRMIKEKRRVALTNTSFMEQLVDYASSRGLLDNDISTVPAREYFRPINRHRIITSHLPTFL